MGGKPNGPIGGNPGGINPPIPAIWGGNPNIGPPRIEKFYDLLFAVFFVGSLVSSQDGKIGLPNGLGCMGGYIGGPPIICICICICIIGGGAMVGGMAGATAGPLGA